MKKKTLLTLSPFEFALWVGSVILVLLAFLLFDRTNYLNLAASLVGVTALIFVAKGNPISQVLMIAFCVLYGIISYQFGYYGELMTYAGMSGPMAVLSLISWLRHPYKGKKSEVQVNHIRWREVPLALLLTLVVTLVFYPILAYFGTANLIPSTFSVATSFLAVYLTFRRSPYYALAYALNDIVLIVLWTLASLEDISNLSVVMCFVAFLANDIHGFLSWRRMEKTQST